VDSLGIKCDKTGIGSVLGVSLKKIASETGLAPTTVKRRLDEAGVRRLLVGRTLLFDPAGVERVLGFEGEMSHEGTPMLAEDIEKMKEIVGG